MAIMTDVGNGASPPRTPTPKLGNFSEVFELCLQIGLEVEAEGGRCETPSEVATITSLPSTPPLPSLLLEPHGAGFLSGLSLPAGDPQSDEGARSTPSDEDDDSAKQSSFSQSSSYSTPASSPASTCERAAAIGPPSEPQRPDFVTIPFLNGFGGCGSGISIPTCLLTTELASSPLFQPDPRYITRGSVAPRYLTDRKSKLALLQSKLFRQDQLDRRARATCGLPASSPVHIFVDLSNIIIGFYDRLKLNYGMPVQKKIKAPPFFFEAFAHVMERGRVTARKVIAGSTVDGADRTNWPMYMQQAEGCGYEMNILSRVAKMSVSPKRPTRRTHGAANGWTTSDPPSSDDGLPAAQTRHGEQAVDEIIHLKMCHSVLDHSPSTIVLATGDAAQAEFSDGFLRHVERALERGWCVELLSWSRGISSSWRSLQRNAKWGDRFRIIELDEFVEEFHGVFLEG